MPIFRCRANRSRTNPAAYTLIELLIVVVLLGIAASMVVPKITGRDSLTIQAAARQLISDLSFAQSDALAQQEYRRVYFFPDGSGYAILRVSEGDITDASWSYDAADAIIDPMSPQGSAGSYIVSWPENSNFEHVATFGTIDGSPFITYDSLGGTVKASGADIVPGTGLGGIMAVQGTDSYLITVAPFTGKLTVQKWPP